MTPLAFTLALGTLASEDLACIAAGLLVARGELGIAAAIVACLAGILAGDLLLYVAGRWLGRAALRRAPLRWLVRPDDLARGEAWFARRGPSAVLASRFVPGTRLPTYLAAGVLEPSAWRFALWCAIAGALWTPLLVGLSARFGTGFAGVAERAEPLVVRLAAAGLLALLLVRMLAPLVTWRGRRLLLSRWRRLTRWEFWPMWAFYPPVALYVLRLALRHRSLRLVTCANPGIPGGGIAGESKYAILDALRGAEGFVARTALVAHTADAVGRAGAARRAMTELGLAYPVVLKPDVGERGSGVGIIRDEAQLTAWCASAEGDFLVQQYVPGVEAGLFHVRPPGRDRGLLFAITEKRFTEVTGDGCRTLEELILADDRAVCMAPAFLARHAARLHEVPAEGVRVPLVELGTHARGATFFDGERLRTPALEAALDEVSRCFPGFGFGRYDVRADSWEALRAGRFLVVELNGVTAEATSIYDPAHSLAEAYRTLFRQWRLCFEVAAAQRDRGARMATWGELRALLRHHRRAVATHVRA